MSQSNNTKAIFFAILTCFLVSVLIAIVRHLSANFHVFFIVMMRNIFAFALFIPFMMRTRKNLFKTKNLNLHIFRNINGFFAMLIWFYAISLIPLPEAVSLTFIVPVFTTLGAMIFLGEKINMAIWRALFIGFIGILIITRPGFQEFKIAHLLVFITTILWSISNLIVKKMTHTDAPETIVGYMSFIMLILSIPLGLTKVAPINLDNIFWLLMLGLFSNLSHLAMSTAYSKADLSLVQPFDFMRLIFTAIISYFAFGEVVDFLTWVGSLIILTGALFAIPKMKKLKQISLDID